MSKLEWARQRLASAKAEAIRMEQAFDLAVRRRDEAEQALIRAEDQDATDCCGVCP